MGFGDADDPVSLYLFGSQRQMDECQRFSIGPYLSLTAALRYPIAQISATCCSSDGPRRAVCSSAPALPALAATGAERRLERRPRRNPASGRQPRAGQDQQQSRQRARCRGARRASVTPSTTATSGLTYVITVARLGPGLADQQRVDDERDRGAEHAERRDGRERTHGRRPARRIERRDRRQDDRRDRAAPRPSSRANRGPCIPSLTTIGPIA